MNCAEFQRILPDITDDRRTGEQEAHLHSCLACSDLVDDLNAISHEARFLRASEEPSPRVWSSIEIALRQEGLIRQPQRDSPIVSTFSHRWKPTWLVPVTAVLLLAFGVVMYERGSALRPTAEQSAAGVAGTSAPAGEDQLLLDAVGTSSPAVRAAYETNLRNVNAYIQDAKESADADPNDEEAQQSLMDAYQQKAMVYEMALNRSLP
jgi:hypothetical protein